MVPVIPLGAWLSVGRLLESVAVNGRLHPQIVPARLGLKGGWTKSDGVEESGLSVVSSMVVTLAASLVSAGGL